MKITCPKVRITRVQVDIALDWVVLVTVELWAWGKWLIVKLEGSIVNTAKTSSLAGVVTVQKVFLRWQGLIIL